MWMPGMQPLASIVSGRNERVFDEHQMTYSHFSSICDDIAAAATTEWDSWSQGSFDNNTMISCNREVAPRNPKICFFEQ